MIGVRSVRNVVDLRDVPFKEQNDEIQKIIDKYDANFLSYIARLYEAINGEKLDFATLKSTIDILAKFNEKQQFNYLNNLLYPEKCRGVKIPSPVPVPSCSFQLHNSLALSTNSNGNLAMYFNPFFLASDNTESQPCKGPNGKIVEHVYCNPIYYSSFFVCNNGYLNGRQPVDFQPINIGQCIPAVYNQYRLVSASIVVKYVGRLDIASGVIGGAIVFDNSNECGSRIEIEEFKQDGSSSSWFYSPRPSYLKKYGNFDLAMDSFYWHENNCVDGIRLLYFPIDNSYEEYVKLLKPNLTTTILPNGVAGQGVPTVTADADYLKNGFGFFIYTQNAPPDSTCFKVDIYCNFECLPDPKFLNYMPVSVCPEIVSEKTKKEAIETIQQKPIMQLTDTNKIIEEKPSFWRKIINKLQGKTPGINKLIATGLVTSKPEMTPENIIAGTIIKENNEMQSKAEAENKKETEPPKTQNVFGTATQSEVVVPEKVPEETVPMNLS